MICPIDKIECGCRELTGDCKKPPKPSIAEIERLAGDVSLALSALLAAVRKLGE